MKSDPETFRRALLDHFDRRRRSLPWRRGRTPYRVMVSEFMLQQTRAETVIPYYDRWLRRFPGWDALADASADDVLLAWKGLGYYRRAQRLHRTAMIVRERYDGRLPEDPAELRTLPGVGEYTAGAVASIAFGLPVPAVDGNVKRVLSRLMDVGDPTAALLRDEATRLLDPERPGDFNEAMMELGAIVCTPRAPRCDDCPVRPHCSANKAGTVADRPLVRQRRPLPRVNYITAVIVRAAASSPTAPPATPPPAPPPAPPTAQPPPPPPTPPPSSQPPPPAATLLTRRPDTGLLAGMWEFPTTEIHRHAAGAPAPASPPASTPISPTPTTPALTHAALQLLASFGLSGDPVAHPPPVKHTFSHFHATYHPVIVLCGADCADFPAMPQNTSAMPDSTPAMPQSISAMPQHPSAMPGDIDHPSPPNTTWIDLARLDDFALPVAQQKIGAQLTQRLTHRLLGSPC